MKSDGQLQRDVMDELRFEPSLNAANIGVTVNEQVVTLTGTVQTFAEKWAAECAVKRVMGTKAVATGQVDWQFQKEAAYAAVRHLLGVVGVSSQVTSWAEHDEAARAAWSAAGVTAVQNLTSVTY